jgi:hypothetical protein
MTLLLMMMMMMISCKVGRGVGNEIDLHVCVYM